MDFIRNLGASTINYVSGMGNMALFLIKTLIYGFTPPLKVINLLKQIRFIGTQSIFLIALIGAFTGMVLSLQGYYTLNKVGSVAFLGPMVALSIIKEPGPVLAGLMVTARAGSAITAEIGINRMIKKDGVWWVYDVYIEGVSLVNNYRSQFNDILIKSSFEDLLKRLKDKIVKEE